MEIVIDGLTEEDINKAMRALVDSFTHIAETGNTSAASVPLALDVAVRDGRIQRGQRVLLEAVGGGMTWGAALIEW